MFETIMKVIYTSWK